MNEINQYVKKHEKRFLEELFELIRIPSVSSLPEHKADMYKAAEKWKEILSAAGADKAEVMETEGNPVTNPINVPARMIAIRPTKTIRWNSSSTVSAPSPCFTNILRRRWGCRR